MNTRPEQPEDAQPPLPQNAQKSEWAKFVAGFGYAFQGLFYALRTQRNARVHLTMAVLVAIVGIILRISTLEFAVIFIVIAGVFIAEMFNTVVELCIDLSTPEYHPQAKIAKDVAAGAVLVSALLAILVGLLILGPPLWTLILHRLAK